MKIGNRIFRNWDPAGQGTLGLSRAIAVSCDIVFYTLGVEVDAQREKLGERLQEVARRFGLGRPTGVDLLGEEEGLVPDAQWKWNRFSNAQTYDRRWFPGDAANLAIGQGFLQVTPLQLAVTYGAIANGGTLRWPQVLKCLAQLNVSRPNIVGEACRSGLVPPSAAREVLARVDTAPEACPSWRAQ